MSRHARVSRAIEELLARLHGPFEPALTRAEVLAAIGRRGLESAVAHSELVSVLPGIYVAGDLAQDHRVRCAAVRVWSKGRILIGGESALHLANPRFAAPARVRAIGPPHWNARPPSWLDLSRRPMPRTRSTFRMVPCLTAEDALLDAWARAPAHRRKDILYQALWLKIVGVRRLISEAARRRRLPGRAHFDAIMRDFLDGATSPSEVMAKREVFTGQRFRDLEWHVAMRIAGRDRTADSLHRARRVVIELDGAGYHSSRAAVDSDRTRDVEFASEGWHTVRFSFRDLRERPEWCREMLLRVLATRRPRP